MEQKKLERIKPDSPNKAVRIKPSKFERIRPTGWKEKNE